MTAVARSLPPELGVTSVTTGSGKSTSKGGDVALHCIRDDRVKVYQYIARFEGCPTSPTLAHTQTTRTNAPDAGLAAVGALGVKSHASGVSVENHLGR